ncbi:MAG TPA: hypothetical protein VHW02_10020 [Rhizomicrobium sp.]|jgi:hypothetical protein|nr:hypothetical protein [Rhizomicrobium sp.]
MGRTIRILQIAAAVAIYGTARCNAASSPLEASLEAVQTGNKIELSLTVTNRSGRPVCYPVTKGGAWTVRQDDGRSTVLLLPDDRHIDTNPNPIQVVPNDGYPHKFDFAEIAPGNDAKNVVTIGTHIFLYDCDAMIATGPQAEIFSETVSANVTR